MSWTNVVQELAARRPELVAILIAGIVGLWVLWQIVREFLRHIDAAERRRVSEQAACHAHQEKVVERVDATFTGVAACIDRNTAALARVEVLQDRLEQQQQKDE